MFSFFRKKKCIEMDVDRLNKMLVAVLEKLPSEYSIYLKQIKEGILQDIFPVTGYSDHYIGVSYQREVIKKYEKKGEKDYSITGVNIFNEKMSKDVQLEIFFSYGVIAGVSSDDELILSDLDLNKINIEFIKVKEKPLDGTVKRELLSFGIQSVNESEVFEVKVGDRRMLHLRDLSDGDFLAIEDGDFYLISISLKGVLKISSAHYETIKMNLFDLTEDDIYSFIQE
ncbi:hypothetical protein [Cytobacillus massiliigabonensis]|uniref:hypothetical protein n=1 Tax=Cytobacillus massiliigabonensis TaxID=1871011 RepID=UPI000C85918B|nr:hypothetical protein [Cytobacillus massiliigabonensis]